MRFGINGHVEKDFGYTDSGLGPQVRDLKDVPSLHEVVLAHFQAKPVEGDVNRGTGARFYRLSGDHGEANARAVDPFTVFLDPEERDGR